MKASIEIEVSEDQVNELLAGQLRERSALYESLRGQKEPEWDKMADALLLVLTIF